MRSARAASAHAVQAAEQTGDKERGALFGSAVPVYEALYGDFDAARKDVAELLKRSNGRDVEYAAAFALARAGDTSRALALAKDLEKRFPEDTSVRFSYLPALHALAALNAGDPAKALDALQPAAPYELGLPHLAFDGNFGALYPIYIRGEAFLAAHRAGDAAAEFQKIIDHRGVIVFDPIGAFAWLGLGRASTMAGETANARAAYENLLKLWKNADPGLAIVERARAEFAKLR